MAALRTPHTVGALARPSFQACGVTNSDKGEQMRVRAAIAHAAGHDWSVEHIEIGEPQAGEVQVRTAYAGLCHSDEHVLTGDLQPPPESLAMFGVTEWYRFLVDMRALASWRLSATG
jgi:hypothetical protein